MSKKVLLIDNYCSFTFNQVHYLGELGADLVIKRNDEISLEDIEQLKPEKIVVSSGPCTPNEAGISLSLIKQFAGKIPILGVCLGHQSIGQAFGGKIVHAKKIMHGKTCALYHENKGVFAGLPNPYTVVRYHSLVIDPNSLPDDLEITAWTQDDNGGFDEIMAVKHKKLAVEGVQFHPESLMTEYGHNIFANFLKS